MLLSAALKLFVQLAQTFDSADIAPLASEQAAAHPPLRHPVTEQGRQLAGTARETDKGRRII